MIIDNNTDRKWKILKSEYLFHRPWLTVRRDCVKLPSGVTNPEFYVLEYPDWVNVIAITTDGKFLMERQYRHGLGITAYELCAGVCEAGETPLESIKRELYEEAGYGGGKWEEIMTVSGNSSTTSNLTHCFVATGVEPVSSQHLESTEDITIHLLSVDEVRRLLTEDRVCQALMAAPLWKYFSLHHLL
jgi:ADP-ribose pyrophosphatase